MADQKIFVTYSEELRQAIAKADVDLTKLVKEELQKEGIAGKVELAPDPTARGEEDRDVFLVILASGVAVSLVGAAVARVIDAVTARGRAAMEEKDLQVAMDGQGKPIRDRSGNPVYNVISRPAAPITAPKEQTEFQAGKLLKFSSTRS